MQRNFGKRREYYLDLGSSRFEDFSNRYLESNNLSFLWSEEGVHCATDFVHILIMIGINNVLYWPIWQIGPAIGESLKSQAFQTKSGWLKYDSHKILQAGSNPSYLRDGNQI
jgi:hypothetical protein